MYVRDCDSAWRTAEIAFNEIMHSSSDIHPNRREIKKLELLMNDPYFKLKPVILGYSRMIALIHENIRVQINLYTMEYLLRYGFQMLKDLFSGIEPPIQ
jgi:hypothetical protein